MSNETEFVNGLSFKPPHERAPEYVLMRGSIKVADLIEWLKSREGEWVNFDVKKSQAGKIYPAVDNWKPSGTSSSGSRGGAPQRQESKPAPADDFVDSDIPF